MVTFGEKAKIKKAGNLNKGRSYVTITVNTWRSKREKSELKDSSESKASEEGEHLIRHLRK